MKTSVARLLVRFLKEAGVRHIFGVSGHSIFDITDALYGDPEIQFVQAMHEGPAAYMAAAYAKATRHLGVCVASSGAGATNLLTGMAYAYKESIPLVALCSDVRSRESGKGASSWHEIPQREMFEPVSKMSVTLKAESALDSLREAVRQATSGRKGPVYVGIPRDVQNLEVAVPESPWLAEPLSPPVPDSAAIDSAADDLKQAAAPMIIAGGGVYWSGAEKELQELAELLGAPFATTPSHKGLLSEEHPLSLGVVGFGAFPFANSFCLESDVVLAVGATFSEALTLGYGNKVIPERARIIHVDIDRSEIGKIYPVRHAVVGDARFVLRALISRLQEKQMSRSSDRLERLAREKRAWREKLQSHAYNAQAPIDQWHVYRALMEAMSDETIVVGAGGTTELIKRFIAPGYAYHSGDFRAIGSGLGTSIGVALACAGRPVACVTGDGSFMLETQEMATAAAWNVPISIIVIRNDAYGNMKRDQIRHWGGRIIGTDLSLPDLCALAAAYGIDAQRVERPPELRPALKHSLSENRLSLKLSVRSKGSDSKGSDKESADMKEIGLSTQDRCGRRRCNIFGVVGIAFLFWGTEAVSLDTVYMAITPGKNFQHVIYPIAQEKGYMREEGIDLKLLVIAATPSIQGLFANSIQFTVAGTSALIAAAKGAAPVKVVFAANDKVHQWLLSKPDITSVKSLKGKRIATAGVASSSTFMLKQVLLRHGLDPDRDVLYIHQSGGTQLAALLSGSVDAIIVGVQPRYIGVNAGMKELIFFGTEVKNSWATLATSDRLIKEQPKQVGGFIRATLKALRFIRHDRDTTIAAYVKFSGVERSLATRMYDDLIGTFTRNGAVDEETQKNDLSIIRQITGVPEPIPIGRAYDFTFAYEADRQLNEGAWRP